MRTRSLAAAALVGAGLTAAAVTAPVAQAAPPTLASTPISVYQIPAVGLQFSGLAVPMPLVSNVLARSGARSGDVVFSAPASPSTCSASGGGALVRVDFRNLATGRAGAATVKPCPYFLDPAPTAQQVHTGSGPVVITVRLVGSHPYPNAGQPSLPGVGTFTAR